MNALIILSSKYILTDTCNNIYSGYVHCQYKVNVTAYILCIGLHYFYSIYSFLIVHISIQISFKLELFSAWSRRWIARVWIRFLQWFSFNNINQSFWSWHSPLYVKFWLYFLYYSLLLVLKYLHPCLLLSLQSLTVRAARVTRARGGARAPTSRAGSSRSSSAPSRRATTRMCSWGKPSPWGWTWSSLECR